MSLKRFNKWERRFNIFLTNMRRHHITKSLVSQQSEKWKKLDKNIYSSIHIHFRSYLFCPEKKRLSKVRITIHLHICKKVVHTLNLGYTRKKNNEIVTILYIELMYNLHTLYLLLRCITVFIYLIESRFFLIFIFDLFNESMAVESRVEYIYNSNNNNVRVKC